MQANTGKTQNPEQGAWKGAKVMAGILIKKACEHPTCGHYKCEKGLRLGGMDI